MKVLELSDWERRTLRRLVDEAWNTADEDRKAADVGSQAEEFLLVEQQLLETLAGRLR